MYVCLCTGVSDSDIRNAVGDGATTVEAVMLATRAGSRCGTCRREVAGVVAAALAGEDIAPRASRACCREDGKRHLTLHDDVDERAA